LIIDRSSIFKNETTNLSEPSMDPSISPDRCPLLLPSILTIPSPVGDSQIVVVLDARPLYHMAELSKPNWISRGDDAATLTGDEDLTADGDTAEEGGSSGAPSDDDEGDGQKNESDEEEEEDEEETKGKRSAGDDSSSVKSIRIFPRKNHPQLMGDSEGMAYDDVSVMSSSVN
jgi:hypothetical protein